MNHKLDKRVEYAVHQLWCNPWNANGSHAKRLLEEAAQDGDGDAYFFLGRCYLGRCFVNPRFGFPEDENLGIEFFQKSLELGSAIGMMGTMRLGGFEPRSGSFINSPYSSYREIWDEVNEMAENGQLYCKYMIANACYWGDWIELLEVTPDQGSTELVVSIQIKAIELFEFCIRNCMQLPIGNLIDMYKRGKYGVPVDLKRVSELEKIRRNLENAHNEIEMAKMTMKTNELAAVNELERLLRLQDYRSCYYLGVLNAYQNKTPVNFTRAKEYFELGIEHETKLPGCQYELGRIYFLGSDEIPKDYDKAFQLLSAARESMLSCADLLGTCYLKGWGTAIDYVKAKSELEICPLEELSNVGLGEIYCFGLGVKQNISKGMHYLNKFPKNPRTIEAKKQFKKKLLGWEQITC